MISPVALGEYVGRQVYVGKTPELQGKTALLYLPAQGTLNHLSHPAIVMAQFDDMKLVLGTKRMDLNWYPFPKQDFQPEGAKPVF